MRDAAREGPRCYTGSIMRAARDLLNEAMSLSEKERLGLAAELIASVEGAADPDWEQAWLAELEKREETEPTPDEDWSVVRKRLFGRLLQS